ncbi:MAG TPA: zf-HC2 domain-containing protein, partial [Blastocatellia bacterium]|nr:zf-HC2 domain-containing protein [Blastocatellia bacterium]
MSNERNNTALEFETMLRRHLKSGGAPVAPCAGFDFEAASAYLEDALGQSHRADYELHLAGCVTCRRHLIELSRLAQTAPRAETQPVTVMGQTPAWVRWREVVTGWFDLSSWNLKWQIAGATGAAFAILIAALGLQSWRQASKHSESAIAVNTGEAALVAPSAAAPTPEPSESNGQLMVGANGVA